MHLVIVSIPIFVKSVNINEHLNTFMVKIKRIHHNYLYVIECPDGFEWINGSIQGVPAQIEARPEDGVDCAETCKTMECTFFAHVYKPKYEQNVNRLHLVLDVCKFYKDVPEKYKLTQAREKEILCKNNGNR